MKDLVHVWNANHDIQYVLDPYSCVVYICDYLTKNNKGMSKLLKQATKDVNSYRLPYSVLGFKHH